MVELHFARSMSSIGMAGEGSMAYVMSMTTTRWRKHSYIPSALEKLLPASLKLRIMVIDMHMLVTSTVLPSLPKREGVAKVNWKQAGEQDIQIHLRCSMVMEDT